MMRLPFVARARAFRPRSSLASSVVVRTKLLHFATLMFSPFFVAGVTTLACGITNRLSARTSRDRSNQSVVADAEPGPTPTYKGKSTLSVTLEPRRVACSCCARRDASTSSTSPSNGQNENDIMCALVEPVASSPKRSTAPKPDPFSSAKRSRYLSWDDYFMSVAFLSAQRSKDPNKQVGACVVGKDKLILGVGYNGFPRGCADDALPWSKKSANDDPLETKYAYVCHAEMNAIMNKNSASVAGGSLYVTMYPCNECAKLIIQAGIEEVVYYEGKISEAKTEDGAPNGSKEDPIYAASNRLLKLAGVRVRQHKPSVAIEVTYIGDD